MGCDKSDPVWRRYDQSFREDVHQLLAWGYQDSLAFISPDKEETEITGFIAEAIQARLNSFEIDGRFDRYNVKDDNPIPGEGRTGKRRMRIDIILECSDRPRFKTRPRYIFEAKRLSKPNNGMGKYVGEEGLLRFIQNRYGSEFPEVAMVGYVQTDDATYWGAALKNKLDSDEAGQFCIVSALTKTSVIPDFVDEWTSTHTRSNGMQIIIFHLLLDCSNVMAQNTTAA